VVRKKQRDVPFMPNWPKPQSGREYKVELLGDRHTYNVQTYIFFLEEGTCAENLTITRRKRSSESN